jgi:GT2 family glycosyltransferase
MQLSIVVITWNGIDYLKQTVPHLVKQANKNTEIIYLINGSTDGTFEYLSKFQQIKIITLDENQGTSVGRNTAIENSTGEYILMLDDDMLLDQEDYLPKLIKFYESLDNPGAVMPLFMDKEEISIQKAYYYGSNYLPWGINTRHKKHQKIVDLVNYPKPVPIAIFQNAAVFIKRTIWEDIGGFDTSQKFNLDDDDLSTRLNVYGYTNYLYNAKPLIHIGFSKRQDKHKYEWNSKSYISGKSKALLKNMQWTTLWYMLPLSISKMMVEGTYHAVYYRYFPIFTANLYSLARVFKDLPDTLKRRKVIQARRTRPDKEFLWVKTPDFEKEFVK